jgi:hypothetical protein
MKYLISLLLVLGSRASASADSQHTVAATVPFDFVVGGEILPAGTYCISQSFSAGTSLLRVRSRDDAAETAKDRFLGGLRSARQSFSLRARHHAVEPL